jgi:hypothetical protein
MDTTGKKPPLPKFSLLKDDDDNESPKKSPRSGSSSPTKRKSSGGAKRSDTKPVYQLCGYMKPTKDVNDFCVNQLVTITAAVCTKHHSDAMLNLSAAVNIMHAAKEKLLDPENNLQPMAATAECNPATQLLTMYKHYATVVKDAKALKQAGAKGVAGGLYPYSFIKLVDEADIIGITVDTAAWKVYNNLVHHRQAFIAQQIADLNGQVQALQNENNDYWAVNDLAEYMEEAASLHPKPDGDSDMPPSIEMQDRADSD